jgi:pyruvate/2-oxoglutarate dehydrogenase complex dihydrolipoamide dehydrogenase (E3) component
LLSAVGIKTNIENIGLIATDKDKILVNEYYNTTYQVYAIGDVTRTVIGSRRFAEEGINCVEKLLEYM